MKKGWHVTQVILLIIKKQKHKNTLNLILNTILLDKSEFVELLYTHRCLWLTKMHYRPLSVTDTGKMHVLTDALNNYICVIFLLMPCKCSMGLVEFSVFKLLSHPLTSLQWLLGGASSTFGPLIGR